MTISVIINRKELTNLTEEMRMITMEELKANKKRAQQEALAKKYEFRYIRPEEADQTAVIEKICFPPNEACSDQDMICRMEAEPNMCLVAVDRETGKIAGFLSGLATNETAFRDEFFKNPKLHNPVGTTVMLLGLDVLPKHRGQGLARELMERYIVSERERGRKRLVLTCLEGKIGMYERMGFAYCKISASVLGNVTWHEMDYLIREE